MKKLTRLIPAAAVLAATLATPTAAAADVCASVGYSLLGSGTDIKKCHNTGYSTVTYEQATGDPNSVQLRTSVTLPVPVRNLVPAVGDTDVTRVTSRAASGAMANRPI